MTNKNKKIDTTIAKNKKVWHDYIIEEKFEAGIVLQGWEVKSIRAGKVQLRDSHIHIKNNEAWLFNALINPLFSASTHVTTNASSTRKLLLHRREINKLMGTVEQKGYTVVPLVMYWKNHNVKVEIAIAKGKQMHDKRQASKDHDWKREKERLFKSNINK